MPSPIPPLPLCKSPTLLPPPPSPPVQSGPDDLALSAVKTLEVWVDYLNPEFLEPAMSEVIADLMHGLWALLKYNNPLATKVSWLPRYDSLGSYLREWWWWCHEAPRGSRGLRGLSKAGRE